MHSPYDEHWTAVRRISRYIRGINISGTPIIWCDNSSTVSLAANLVLHAKVKHVELDLHFIWERVLYGELQINHVPGYDQVVDVLTKPLTVGSFLRCRESLTLTTVFDSFVQVAAEGILATTEQLQNIEDGDKLN
ncbi:hypothetical protein PVK06_036036 [Gossypium arboreum]|uniref:Uncharacterized protein n=1 Tax=Gossypium arboreum TaxID=29729 RepID=A0ABR0NIX8_GOSAR|nr:hypothetical protein PVK06_036036 [Gossypium arboreum]